MSDSKLSLWSFTTVKDEEDIIESFVRYHMNFLDGMVISDNLSNDNTLSILKRLKKEGYNIDILEDKNRRFDQVKTRNNLLKYTIKKHEPDVIFPIDADEFICSKDGGSPRRVIKKLTSGPVYSYRMHTYVLPVKYPKEKFLPSKFALVRKEGEYEQKDYKCFITKDVYNKNISLMMGSHGIIYNNKSEYGLETDLLYLAHFPVRSKSQLMNKVIIGRINNMALHSREEGPGFHQYNILDGIIATGTIPDDILIKESEHYNLKDNKEKIETYTQKFRIDFCNNIEPQYSSHNNNLSILSNTIRAAESCLNYLRNELNRTRDDNANQKQQLEKIERDNESLKQSLLSTKQELESIYKSKRWILSSKIAKIVHPSNKTK